MDQGGSVARCRLIAVSTVWISRPASPSGSRIEGILVERGDVGAYPRVGVDYAGEWAKKPWRFRLRTVTAPTRTRLTKKQGAPDRSGPPVISR